jgi:glycosyltransferase involved in cell wall biosynthesis
MIASADCYVSLHRAEGFGHTIAEALALGTPVIATGASGNLEYMDAEMAHLVGAAPAPVSRGVDPYDAGAMWFEPDLDHAALLMRRVWENPSEARRRAAFGRRRILTEHGRAAAIRTITQRFAAIEERRLAGYESRVAEHVRLLNIPDW